MLKRVMGSALCAIAIAALGAQAAQAAGPGIEGKVAKVDAAKGSLTITTAAGEKTFTVTDGTQIIGPRGGIVHKRLNDRRFHEGLPITVVANGENATQLLLGVDRKKAAKSEASSSTSSPTSKSGTSTQSSGFRGESTKSDEEDDDNDYPGKVKSVDADKNLLVVTLMNGKDRSFMVSSEAKLTIGRRVSQKGLSDPALKAGASVMVVTEEGGHKVKEVKVQSGARRLRSGGVRSVGRPPATE
jgi:outer membrane lipoprotein-sorting protein